MYSIVFDEEATYHILWLFSRLENQYAWSTGDGDNGFQMDLGATLEIISDAVLISLEMFTDRNSERNLSSQCIIDFRTKFKGKTALEYLNNFIEKINLELDIWGNSRSDNGEKHEPIGDKLIPIRDNLQKLTVLLENY